MFETSEMMLHLLGSGVNSDVLARLPLCTDDVPNEWARAIRATSDNPCDDCLRSSADAQPSTHHAPAVSYPSHLVAGDDCALVLHLLRASVSSLNM